MHPAEEKTQKYTKDSPEVVESRKQIFVQEDESWLDSCRQLGIVSNTLSDNRIKINLSDEAKGEKEYKLVWNGRNNQNNLNNQNNKNNQIYKEYTNSYIVERIGTGESEYIYIGRKPLTEFPLFDRYTEELDRLEWYSEMGTQIMVYYQRILSLREYEMVKGKLLEASNCYLAEYKEQKMEQILSSLESSIYILGYLGYTYSVKEDKVNYIRDILSAKIKVCLMSCKSSKEVLNVAYTYGLLGEKYHVIPLADKSTKHIKSELKKNLEYNHINNKTNEEQYSRLQSRSMSGNLMKTNSPMQLSRRISGEGNINIIEPMKCRLQSGSSASLLETETKVDELQFKISNPNIMQKVILLDHNSLGKILADPKFETLLLQVIVNSNAVIGYDLTSEDKALFVRFLQGFKADSQVLALAVSAGDVPMMQQADISISFRPVDNNNNNIEDEDKYRIFGSCLNTRVNSDIEITHLSSLLPLIFSLGIISQILLRKVLNILYFMGLFRGLYITIIITRYNFISFELIFTPYDIFFDYLLILVYLVIFFDDFLPIQPNLVIRFPMLYKFFRKDPMNLNHILRLYFSALPLAIILVILHYTDKYSLTYLGNNSDAHLFTTYDLIYQYIILLSLVLFY